MFRMNSAEVPSAFLPSGWGEETLTIKGVVGQSLAKNVKEGTDEKHSESVWSNRV